MNAFVVVAYTSLEASGAMDQAFAAGIQPVAYAGDVSAVLTAVLLVVVTLGTIDWLIRRHRRQRGGGHGPGVHAARRRKLAARR